MKLNNKLAVIFSLFILVNCNNSKKELEKEKRYYCIEKISIVTKNHLPTTPYAPAKFYLVATN